MGENLSIDLDAWIHGALARWWKVELSLDTELPPWKQSDPRLRWGPPGRHVDRKHRDACEC